MTVLKQMSLSGWKGWRCPLGLAGALAVGGGWPAAAGSIDFNRDIRPVINRSCLSCHGGVSKKGGFSLLFREEALSATRAGRPAIVPGDPEGSELMRRLTTDDPEQRMPAGKEPLAAEEIDRIRQWVAEGATWVSHWAYRLPGRAQWAEADLDTWVAARLSVAGLGFSSEADRATLLRRVSLDLTGLPPTREETEAFRVDEGPGAYERQVDRLLASPRFGERWASLWLDLARYADTQGYEKDNRRSIWAYRDWVVDAFNRDLPFDQFTVEQLAGDLLPEPTPEQQVATGFHRNTMTNTEGGTDNEEFRVAAVVDRVNTTWEVWMGTSFGCVQCHSHPYDPIRHREYYQFMAFFNNTADADRDDDAPWVEVLSREQRVRQEALNEEIALRQKRLETVGPDLEGARRQWEDALRSVSEPTWQVVRPVEAKALHEVALHMQEDGSLLASGPNPDQNTYTLTLPPGLTNLTGFRLQVLPHESLPHRGPGRSAGGGNFVLTEFEVWADGALVPLRCPTADFEQAGGGPLTPYGTWSARGALDGDVYDARSGWAVGGQAGQAHQWVVETCAPLSANQLVVALKQNHGNGSHTLGRFQLEVTQAPGPLRASGPAEDQLRTLLAKPVAERSPEEVQRLDRQFLAETPLREEVRREWLSRQAERNAIRGPTTLVMRELQGGERRVTRVFVRGNWMTHGEEVSPAIPEVFRDLADHEPTNRLELARWIVGASNPLTARVMVNRFWEQLFGVGIVETLEDFGSMGEPPVNQALLDWLAIQFQHTHDWSVKKLLRQIVLSRTYRQDSKVTPALWEQDPYNRLLARGPRFRLSAEMIRDQALAVSGLLSPKRGGPSVMPPQPDGVWQVVYNGEQWQTAEGEDRYRRALYTFWRRTSPYPSMMAFDAPSREFCTNRRIRTNTPLAALVTLNDPVYLEAAQALGRRMRREGGPDPAQGLGYGYALLQGRSPGARTMEELISLHQRVTAHLQPRPESAVLLGPSLDEAVFTVLANVLLNLDAVITKE